MLRRVVPTLLEISREPDDSVADVRRKEAAGRRSRMMHTLWRDGKTRSASGARSGSGRLVNAGPRPPRFVQAPERSVTVETILPASQPAVCSDRP